MRTGREQKDYRDKYKTNEVSDIAQRTTRERERERENESVQVLKSGTRMRRCGTLTLACIQAKRSFPWTTI
jgi:hypothetical protein